jgi:hypothetical protein
MVFPRSILNNLMPAVSPSFCLSVGVQGLKIRPQQFAVHGAFHQQRLIFCLSDQGQFNRTRVPLCRLSTIFISRVAARVVYTPNAHRTWACRLPPHAPELRDDIAHLSQTRFGRWDHPPPTSITFHRVIG